MRIFISILFILCSQIAQAATYTVTSDGELDTAIAALNPGDTIIIGGSFTSDGPYIIEDANVIIYGNPTTSTVTLGTNDNYLFTISATGCTVRDFRIDGDKANRTTGTGILLAADSATISGMTIEDMFNYGLLVSIVSQDSTVTSNTITNIGGTGINKAIYGNCIRINAGGTGTFTSNILSNDASGSDEFFSNGADGSTITGGTISGGDSGIHLYDSSDSWTITNVTINNVGIGSVAGADMISVDGTNNIISGITGTQSVNMAQAVAGIEFSGGDGACDGSTVSDSSFTGAYLDYGLLGGGSDIAIYRTLFESLSGNIQNNCSGSDIYSNVFITGGLVLDSNAAGARAANVYNNTFYGAGAGNGLVLEETNGTWTISTNVKNNIFYGWAKGCVVQDKDDDGVVVVHTNNDYFGNTANIQKYAVSSYSNISLDASEVTGDPKFYNPALHDFRVHSDGAGVDKGTDLGETYQRDYYGHWQGDNGALWDIGAYLYFDHRPTMTGGSWR